MPIRILPVVALLIITIVACGPTEARANDAAREAMNKALGIESPPPGSKSESKPQQSDSSDAEKPPRDAVAEAAAAAGATVDGVPFSRTAVQIENLHTYYLDMFDKHLKEPDWMARVMGVISLAKVDDPRFTHRLLKVMRTDREPIVRIYAWEALHGRHTKLDEENRDIWKRIGFDLFEKNLLRGDLRLGIIGLIEEGGPTPRNKKLLMHIFSTCNSINPSDIRTLWAIGDTIKHWQSGDMVRSMIEAMGTLDTAYRAEVVMSRLNNKIPNHGTYRFDKEAKIYPSSATMWSRVTENWVKWFKEQEFKEVSPADCPPYTRLSEIMPHGEKIVDTADPKWRKDLELKRFRLDQLDVCIVLDTTASMGGPLEWVKKGVIKMMRMFELISREPRIGVTLYRDNGDAYVTKVLPLSPKAAILSKLLEPEGPKGGGDIPEAVLEALVAAVRGQRWSPSPAAKKIIVLITDAPAQEKTVDDIVKFVKQETEKGFQFHGVKVRTSKWVERTLKLPNWDPELTSIEKVADAGNGHHQWVAFWTQSQKNPRWRGTANPSEGNQAERAIFTQVMRAALEENYHDRIIPFISVLLEYIEEPVPEKREAFGEAKPSPGGRPTDAQMNR